MRFVLSMVVALTLIASSNMAFACATNSCNAPPVMTPGGLGCGGSCTGMSGKYECTGCDINPYDGLTCYCVLAM